MKEIIEKIGNLFGKQNFFVCFFDGTRVDKKQSSIIISVRFIG